MSDTKYLMAFNLLKPNKAIKTEAELNTLYVERPDSPLEELRTRLLDCDEPEKILFTGHIGCGKSSELRKLTADISDRYIVVNYSVKDRLNLVDLSYLDLAVMNALTLLDLASKENLELKSDLKNEIQGYINEISKDIEFETIDGRGTHFELQGKAGILSTKFSLESETRKRIREKVTPKLDQLVRYIDLLADGISEIRGKKVILIVDDLEKADIEPARDIFINHSADLVRPNHSIIYTFPLAFFYETSFASIKNYYDSIQPLPIIKCTEKDGKICEAGYEVLRKLLFNRLPEEMINTDAVEALVKMSGGLPRYLIRIAQNALLLISSFSIWIFKGSIIRLDSKRRLKRVIPAKESVR